MAWDPGLAERLAALIGLRFDLEEKKMFGGGLSLKQTLSLPTPFGGIVPGLF